MCDVVDCHSLAADADQVEKMEQVFANDRKREDEEADRFVRAERIIQSRTNELASVEAFEHNNKDEVSTAIMSQ